MRGRRGGYRRSSPILSLLSQREGGGWTRRWVGEDGRARLRVEEGRWVDAAGGRRRRAHGEVHEFALARWACGEGSEKGTRGCAKPRARRGAVLARYHGCEDGGGAAWAHPQCNASSCAVETEDM